ncbi:hypothetical protein EDD18DRAFT_1114701 [Armillaria luteobubalina]|uniref:Uncharacterized protein n=1 Tax=Armillaria luteobubalina TaxID=153913 RepID=A0AA39P4K7_9AGAR|nr:hypothetical protein EDD18DRAFT_1114701 [Armillaria luteobubalina]
MTSSSSASVNGVKLIPTNGSGMKSKESGDLCSTTINLGEVTKKVKIDSGCRASTKSQSMVMKLSRIQGGRSGRFVDIDSGEVVEESSMLCAARQATTTNEEMTLQSDMCFQRSRCLQETPGRWSTIGGQRQPDTRWLLGVLIGICSTWFVGDGRGNGTLLPPLPPRQNIYAPIPSPSQEYIVHNCRQRDVDQLQSQIPKMLFNLFNTMLTEMEVNITSIREHARIEACLEELMPTLQSSLGQRLTDANELDFVVYDLIDLSAKNNVAALFSPQRRLLGVISWATTGTVTTFKTHASLLHPAPYRVVGTNGLPDSLFIHDPFMDAEMSLPMGFVVQL